MAQYTTEAEYVTAIAETQLAISRQVNIGHSHINRSGGSERSTTEVALSTLRKHLAILQMEYEQLVSENNGEILSQTFGPGW